MGNVFKDREAQFNSSVGVRAFAVHVKNKKEFYRCINGMETPNHTMGFLHCFMATRAISLQEVYKNISKCIDKKETYILFNEDLGHAYPDTKREIQKNYKGIKILEYCEL